MGNGNSVSNTIEVSSRINYSLLEGSWWLVADYGHWETDTTARHVFEYHAKHSGVCVKVLKYYAEEIKSLEYILNCDPSGSIVSMTMDNERHLVRLNWTDYTNMLILSGKKACGQEFMSVFTRDKFPADSCWGLIEKVLTPCDNWAEMRKAPGAFENSSAFRIGLDCPFDAKLYSGKWWEAGRYPLIWEKSCVRSKADYTINTKTEEILVTNYCYNEFDDLLDKRQGTAEKVEEGRFSLTFDDGRESSSIGAPYVVAWTDYENYAIVGCLGRDDKGNLIKYEPESSSEASSSQPVSETCASDVVGASTNPYHVYGWLLSRKKQIPDIEKNWLCAKLLECGYKPGNMLWASGLMV